MKPQDIEDIYELSPLQQGIVFHQLQSPDSRVYYVQATATLRGPLDEDALRRAWQHVVDRNPVLRTGFRWQELDKPLQIVHRHVAAAMTTCDWRLLPPAARRAQLDALAESDRERDFELSTPPLVRLALIRTGDEEHELLWSHHHILMDGWSFNLLLSELAACYDAFARGEAYAAPPRPPYRRYVEWLQARDAARTAAFWRERLAGKTAPTRIAGVSRACRDLSGPPSGFEPVHVSPDVTARLRQASRHRRVTMNTMVLAAWSLVLRRHSGDSDVLFGVTVSGRSDSVAQAEWMIGLFINTVPVRIDVPATVPVAEWVRAIQARHSEAFEHAHAALVDIRSVSDISAGWPFFESLVVFERYPVGEQQGASGEPRRLAIEPQSRWTEGGADYPLTLCVAETAEGLAGTLSYDAKAVDRALGVRLARHFERVLDSLAAGPERRVADLEMLTPGEREHLLAAPAPLPAEAPSLSDLFEAQVERTPDRLAVVDEQRGWTYSELNDAAARVAAALRRRGVGAESLVGIYAHRSVAMVAALLGTQKARAAFLPLDPAYPPERLRFMLDDAKAAVILTDRRLCETLPATAGA
ncbi:MAG: condensation domain-containing protein, partial [Vicinamibacterales bacterium]